MLFRPRRDRRGRDRFLGAKMALLSAGGGMAIAGFMLDMDWLVTGAILPLVVGLGLSFRGGRDDEPESVDRPDSSADETT